MKCKECGELYGNMKDDGKIVNPILGELCGTCYGEIHKERIKQDIKDMGIVPGYGIVNVGEGVA